MNALWSHLWEFIISLLEAGLFFVLADQKLKGRKFRFFYAGMAAALFIQAGLIFLCRILPLHPLLAISLLAITRFLLAAVFYEDLVSKKILCAVFFETAVIAAEALSAMLPAIILNYDLSELLFGGILRIPFTLLHLGVLSIIVLVSLGFTGRTFHPDNPQKILLIALSFLCISLEELIILEQMNSFSPYYALNRNNLIYVVTFLGKLLFAALVVIFYNIGMVRERSIKAREERLMRRWRISSTARSFSPSLS